MNPSSYIEKLSRRLRGVRTRRSIATQRDRVLARRIYAAVERDLELAALQGLHFYTYRGNVTIYGIVRHQLDHDLLISLVRQIPGVKNVASHLTIQAQQAP